MFIISNVGAIRLILIFFLTFLGGCQDGKTNAKPPELIRPAKVTQVMPFEPNQTRYFPATIEPTVDAMLAFRVNGELAQLHVVAGQSVQAGDVLAQLDDQDFILQLQQAQARFDLTLSKYNRAKSLRQQQLISSSDFEEATAQYDIVLSQLDMAKQNLKYTKITAPFSGTVAQVMIENYEFVQAKQPIMELQGREQVDVSIEVPENLMARLPKNNDGKLYQPKLVLDAAPDQSYYVTFKEHDISPNKVTRTYRVVFSLDVPDDINLLAGMTGQLVVELNKVLAPATNRLLVPVEAVFVPNQFAGQDRHFVYRLDIKNRAQLVEVKVIKLGQRGAQVIPVNEGLAIGDLIISAGSHFITEGQTVRPWIRERGL